MEISIVKIKVVVDAVLNWVRADLAANVNTPTRSWLYREFNGIVLDDTNFYTQLKALLEEGNDDQRRLETRLMFDKDRANLPTIHIHYPTEDGQSGDNTINTGMIKIEEVLSSNVPVYSRSFVGQYDLIITGGNSLQVVMLYEFLDGVLIAAADTLAFHFDRFVFAGKQLMTNPDIIPFLTYFRAITLTLQAKKKVSALVNLQLATDVAFEGTLYTDSQPVAIQQVSVVLQANATTAPAGTVIQFVATPTNGGSTPIYSWFLNGNEIQGETANSLDLNFSQAGTFTVQCKLYSSVQYLLPSPAISNELTIVIT